MPTHPDTFVDNILDDDRAQRVSDVSGTPNGVDPQQALSRQLMSSGESMRTLGGDIDSPNSKTRLLEYRSMDPLGGKNAALETMRRAQSLFRYSLIFINFTFIVAAMLLIMAGVVARENSAVKLCDHCGDLTMVAIVFGVALWLFAIFGFNWIRQRNILLLLVYVAFLVIQSVTLLGVIITAGVFDANTVSGSDNVNANATSYFAQWEAQVNQTNADGVSPLCALQRDNNCSGYRLGCCANSTLCFGDSLERPSWYYRVCPNCTKAGIQPVAKVCGDQVFGDTNNPLLQQWEASVNTSATSVSPLCDLQRQFNCSGYYYGCCTAGTCFNESNPPWWVEVVCPVCPGQDAMPKVCTGVVYETLRKNLGGFLVISCFSMLLILSGILLAFLARKVNQSAAHQQPVTPSVAMLAPAY